MPVRPVLAAALYLAAVLLPNVLIDRFGIVDVVPGPWTLMAPAAVYAVGVALVARDVLDESLGGGLRALVAVIALIVVGTVMSTVFADPRIAYASGAAFLFSEALDLGIFRALRARGWAVAALVSSYAGALADSLLFLWLAFGSLAFLPGQWLGKAVAITVVVAIAGPLRPVWAPRPREVAIT